jgi:hypothetical protein
MPAAPPQCLCLFKGHMRHMLFKRQLEDIRICFLEARLSGRANLETYETHALEEAVGRRTCLLEPRASGTACLRTSETRALKEAV